MKNEYSFKCTYINTHTVHDGIFNNFIFIHRVNW